MGPKSADDGSPARERGIRGRVLMPFQTIAVSQLRIAIAHEAARLSGKNLAEILVLVGPVEIIMPDATTDGWRLSHYMGEAEEIEAIEKAVAKLHRRWPVATRDE